MSLYITAAQPNPPGRDAYHGQTTNDLLNEEWIEVVAVSDRNLVGDALSHLTFNNVCQRTGQGVLIKFDTGQLGKGQHLRLHTGHGSSHWSGGTYHMYLGRSWFVWNNACGDRATLFFQESVIDSAFYRPDPPEGQLVRAQGTDELVPAGQLVYR
jgi:hypothetical protein